MVLLNDEKLYRHKRWRRKEFGATENIQYRIYFSFKGSVSTDTAFLFSYNLTSKGFLLEFTHNNSIYLRWKINIPKLVLKLFIIACFHFRFFDYVIFVDSQGLLIYWGTFTDNIHENCLDLISVFQSSSCVKIRRIKCGGTTERNMVKWLR